MNRRLLLGIGLIACAIGLALAMSTPPEATLASYSTSLAERTRSQRHNARLAADALNGAVLQPGEVLSFSRRVGSFSRDRGYRKAPVSYNGQLIDSWGGGVCQTSTTLYNAALLAGLEVVERNRHRFAPSYVPAGRDAAVAFDSIDLKLRNPHPFPVRIVTKIARNRLEVALCGPKPLEEQPEVVTEVRRLEEPGTARLGRAARFSRTRNTGKRGWDVAVYRVQGNRRELVSVDSYPAMSRIVEGL